MIISELEVQMKSRKDKKDFLTPEAKEELNKIMEGFMVITTDSFYKIFDRLITLQKTKALRAIEVEAAVKILTDANNDFRIVNFKYDDEAGVILKYDPRVGQHVYLKHGTRKDYEIQIRLHGRYYD